MIDTTKAIGKFYNVEYYLGNGKVATFSSKLVDWPMNYLCFQEENGAIDIIEEKAIRSLISIKQPQYYKND